VFVQQSDASPAFEAVKLPREDSELLWIGRMGCEVFGEAFCEPQRGDVSHASFAHHPAVNKFVQEQVAAVVSGGLVAHPEAVAQMPAMANYKIAIGQQSGSGESFGGVHEEAGDLKVAVVLCWSERRQLLLESIEEAVCQFRKSLNISFSGIRDEHQMPSLKDAQSGCLKSLWVEAWAVIGQTEGWRQAFLSGQVDRQG
jgi:hypothetical protein